VQPLVGSTEGVADRNTQSGDAAREKLSVVFYKVKVAFGTDKEIAFGIDFESAADVSGYVIDVAVVDTGVEAAIQVLTVETGAENAETSLKLEVAAVCDLEHVNGVRIGE